MDRTTLPSWISLALGVWLVVAPFVLGATDLPAAMWNHMTVGVLVAALALSRLRGTGDWAAWANIGLAIWLVFSSYVLRYTMASVELSYHDAVVGTALAVMGIASALFLRTPAGMGALFSAAEPREDELRR